MAIANILVNGFPGSNDNIVLNAGVTLANSAAASTYLWTIVSQPSGSPNAVLSSETASEVTFTANKEGSYLIRLVVDAGLPGEASDQVIVAVRELQTGNRIPAAGETTENNSTTGWANTAVDEILQRVTRFMDQGVLVGTAGAAGLLPLDVVYAADVVTIATGLPGERQVPQFEKALADSETKVRGLLGVVLGGVDGSPAPEDGSLIRVSVMTLVQSVPLELPAVPAGTPVYVSDAGTISLFSGTIVRQIGTVLDDMGGNNYGVWITGTGTFGTLQSISAVSPLYVAGAGGVSPQISLSFAGGLTTDGGNLVLGDTGVEAETYGDAAAEPESVMPTFTVDAKGRLTAASEAAITIGGDPAKTYVDNGDATTLAAAEAYAETLAYGLSSKVPVHAGTTIPLPACTVNGTFQTLTANVHGPLLPANTDGHDLLVGERLLVKNEAAPANNGIYVLTQKGASSGPSSPWILTRADDANTAAELCGSLVTVNVGNTLAGSTWIFAFNPTAFTLGTTPVVFTQLNAVPATDTVLGTVQLAGGLGGAGSLAAAPVLALGTGYVSGVLPATNGGTGLSTSGATDAFLVGNGSGGWTTRTTYTGGILNYTGATLVSVPGLRGVANLVPLPQGGSQSMSSVPLETLTTTPFTTRGVAFYIPFTGGTPPAVGNDLYITAQQGQNTGGSLWLFGSESTAVGSAGGTVNIRGGRSNVGAGQGGAVNLSGGDCASGAQSGSVTVRGGNSSIGAGAGGALNLLGGEGVNTAGGSVVLAGGTSGVTPGTVTIKGGAYRSGYATQGADVYIYPGEGRDAEGADLDGTVHISRRPGATSGRIELDDAYINGTGTTGQVLTSNGTGSPPSWQGSAGGTASQGAYRLVNTTYTFTTSDFMVYAIGSTPYTVTLPVAATVPAGRMFIIKSGSSTGVVTLAAAAGEQIDTSTGPWPLANLEFRRVIRVTGVGSEWLFI